jgi:hypothetical protein
MIQAKTEASVEVEVSVAALALWASLHSIPAHRISGSQLERNSASVTRIRSASSSPSSASTQLL